MNYFLLHSTYSCLNGFITLTVPSSSYQVCNQHDNDQASKCGPNSDRYDTVGLGVCRAFGHILK